MRGLIKLTPVNANLSIEIKLEKCGDVYYRIFGEKEWKYTNYTIMESVHNYYVAKRGNRLDKMMQGTKRECLNAIIDLIRIAFTLCQRRY
jgi:hypothetical protein|nr:MAG TPA: hypothetical protein [Microviridae sp.]